MQPASPDRAGPPRPPQRNYFPHVGCIFIHIPKTGGTSVASALGTLDAALQREGRPPAYIAPDGTHSKHWKAATYAERLHPDVWRSAFKFCVVRNPFDQMVSSYHWWLQKAGRFPILREAARTVAGLGSFEAFLDHEFGSSRINECAGEPEHWFLDPGGNDLVDFIVRLEDLDELHTELSRFIELPYRIALPAENQTQREHYSRYYSSSTAEKVAARFRYVIDRFGYEFSGA